jgi:hypothetical protein
LTEEVAESSENLQVVPSVNIVTTEMESITVGCCEYSTDCATVSTENEEFLNGAEFLDDCQEEIIEGNVDMQLNQASEEEGEEFKECQIDIDRIRSVTIRAPVCVAGLAVKAVVDTGAEVTVLSEEAYQAIPAESRPPLQQAKRGLVVAEAGKRMKTRGIICARLELGSQSFDWPMYVAPIADDLLLGCDVLYDKDITVNPKKGLEVDGQWVECEVVRTPSQLMVARTLVDSSEKRISVRLMNLSASPVKLKNGCVIGKLQAVDELVQTVKTPELEECTSDGYTCKINNSDMVRKIQSSLLTDKDVRKPKMQDKFSDNTLDTDGTLADASNVKDDTSKIPDHLCDLYARSSENIPETKERQNSAQLINKQSDSFERSKLELGTYSMIRHRWLRGKEIFNTVETVTELTKSKGKGNVS